MTLRETRNEKILGSWNLARMRVQRANAALRTRMGPHVHRIHGTVLDHAEVSLDSKPSEKSGMTTLNALSLAYPVT